MTWTPYSPDQAGLPWFATREPNSPLDSDLFAVAAVLDSDVTETIDTVWVNLSAADSVTPALDGWELEIYQLGQLLAGDPDTTIYRPTGDGTNTNCVRWNGTAFTTSNLYSGVDESTESGGTYNGRWTYGAQWIAPTYGRQGMATFDFVGTDGDHDNDMVLAVTVKARVAELVFYQAFAAATFRPVLEINGSVYQGDPVTVGGGDGDYTEISHTWFANPYTGRAWTPADIDSFDSSSAPSVTYRAGVVCEATGTPHNLPVVYMLWIETMWTDTDPRVAIGGLRNPSRGWNEIAIDSKASHSATTWSKQALTRYLLVLRRRAGTGFVWWRYLDSGDTMPHVWQRGTPPVASDTYRLQALEDNDDATLGDIDMTGGYAILLGRNDNTISADSQPYASVNDDVSGTGGFAYRWTRVNADRTVQQDLTAPSTDDYPWARVLVCTEDPTTTENLTVTLKRRSNGSTVATKTLTVADLDRPITRWQTAEWAWSSVPALVNSSVYYLEFSCAAERGLGWRVQVLSIGVGLTGEVALAPTAGAGGGNDPVRIDGTSYDELHVAATLHTETDAPTGFTATATAAGTCREVVELDWTQTAISAGGGFDRYEIERSVDAGASWQCIRHITTEATETFTDREGPRNTARQYRIRARRVDGGASAWVTSSSVTADMDCCGYVFASNDHADVLWFADEGPAREYGFLEDRTEVEMHGRFGHVALVSLDDRGDLLSATLLVAAERAYGGTPEASVDGRREFDPLLILAGNKLDPDTGEKVIVPYVSISDSDGNEWLASIRVPRGVRSDGTTYELDIEARQVAYQPSCTVEPRVVEGS